MSKLISSVFAAFTGPAMQKFGAKLTSRAVVAPLVYSMLFMIGFALAYGLVGYNKMFEVTDENKDKNWENSIVASVMLQSNAMGSVTPTTSLGRWLSMAQTFVGWAWYLAIVSILL
jgi:hypothetical protein